MKLFKSLAMLIFPLAMLMPGASNAQLIYPALEINITTGDAGLSLSDGTDLTIDATVTGIIDEFNNFTAITNQTFTLTGTGTYTIFSPAPGTELIESSFNGTFSVGGSLLSGTFTGLTLSGLSSQPTLTGALTYTGGSLQGGNLGGEILLSTAGSHVVGKLGAVVPVPAAVWLFGTGLLGLIAVARRKA